MGLMVTYHKEVIDGPAVRDHKTLVVPFSTEDILHEEGATAARVTVVTVVRSHELTHISVLHK